MESLLRVLTIRDGGDNSLCLRASGSDSLAGYQHHSKNDLDPRAAFTNLHLLARIFIIRCDRRGHARLLIENASVGDFLPLISLRTPRRFRSRLATIRPEMAQSVSRSSVSRESVQASAELLKSLREKLWDTLEILAPRPLPPSPDPVTVDQLIFV